jgi:hypothetical protein
MAASPKSTVVESIAIEENIQRILPVAVNNEERQICCVRPLAIAKIEAIAAQKKKVPSQKKKSKLSLVIVVILSDVG